jgi:hypothetical protein
VSTSLKPTPAVKVRARLSWRKNIKKTAPKTPTITMTNMIRFPVLKNPREYNPSANAAQKKKKKPASKRPKRVVIRDFPVRTTTITANVEESATTRVVLDLKARARVSPGPKPPAENLLGFTGRLNVMKARVRLAELARKRQEDKELSQ